MLISLTGDLIRILYLDIFKKILFSNLLLIFISQMTKHYFL